MLRRRMLFRTALPLLLGVASCSTTDATTGIAAEGTADAVDGAGDATDGTSAADAADATPDAGVDGSTDGTTDATDASTGAADDWTDSTDGTTDSTDDTTDSTDGTSDSTDGTSDSTDETSDSTDETTDSTDGITDATDGATDGTTDSADGTTDSADGTTDATDGATEGTDGTSGTSDGTTDAADGTDSTDGTDASDGTTDPCALGAAQLDRPVALPLGETLFFGSDDYLAFWKDGVDCEPSLASAPAGSTAALVGDVVAGSRRFTPDTVGVYTIDVGAERVTLTVDGLGVHPDNFLNYNYTPETPLALVGDTLVVTATTSNAVQLVTFDENGSAVPGALIPTGAWPTSIVATGETTALIAQTGRDTLGFLDLTSGRVTDAIRVGNEPMGFVVNGNVAWVALAEAHQVVKVDLTLREVVAVLDVGREPRAMVLDALGKRLFVASLISSNAHPHAKADETLPDEWKRDIAIIDLETLAVSYTPEIGTILRGLWLSADGLELVAAVSHSNNLFAEIAADSKPHSHGLVFIDVSADEVTLDDIASLNLDTNVGSAGPAGSPMTMVQAGDQFLVALSASNAIAALDPTTREEVARMHVGNDPRGLVVRKGRVWTYSWLDNQLVGLDLPLMNGILKPKNAVTIGVDPTPLEIRQGQRMFNDAFFSKNKDFSCNNCHIDGLTDGLVWNLLVDGDVNTLAFRNVGGTGPFLWGGQLPTLFDFSREVLKLVGADASGAEMELLTTYMQSVTAPPNPYSGPGGKLTELGELGKQVFDGPAGCGACHSGPLLTNKSMVPGKTNGMLTDVPSLIGVYDTAPYGRKGTWKDIDDMVAYAVEFTGATLTDAELVALTSYVRQIPGDALYLNSASPLNGDNHVWVESPIELMFSQVLVPGQEDHFTIESVPDEGTPMQVAGTWSQSGRVVRFIPSEGLEEDVSYRIRATQGLSAALGQVLHLPIEIDFRTGVPPLTDVSGKWAVTITATQPISGSLNGEMAFLQSKGGKVAGVVLTEFDQASLSHVEGMVSGMTLVLTPFILDVDLGGSPLQVQLESGYADLVDTDGDGFADSGVGEIGALGYTAAFMVVRTSLPESD